MTKIGDQDGIKASMNRLRDLDPGGTLLKKGADGKWPDINTLTQPLDQWKSWDKWEREQRIVKQDHDAAEDEEYRPPTTPTVFECGVFVAGGAGSNESDPTGNGDRGQDYNGRDWSPEQACDAIKRSGYNAILVQLYRERGGDYLAAGRARGMKVGLWDAWPSAERAELALSFAPDFYC